MTTEQLQQVERAIAKLRSLNNGDLGVVHVVACGKQAIPALRRMLFEREPSGLYHARRHAVEALAALGAHDVLIEFLEAERTIADPIERVGEDAVINAAALALANVRDQHLFELLLRLARRPALTSIIGALGAFERVEAIPALINALEEDASRLTAENALRKLGRPACAALLLTVNLKVPSDERESVSSARRRRSALRLLAEMDMSSRTWRDLRPLMHDSDPGVAVLACEIALTRASTSERIDAARRLIELLAQDDWVLREEVEGYLTSHFAKARDAIAQYLDQIPRLDEDTAAKRRTEIILHRIISRADSSPQAR